MTEQDPETIPVIIGVGQINDRPEQPGDGLDPVGLMAEALRRADADAGGGVLEDCDSLTVVAQLAWPQLNPVDGKVAEATDTKSDFGGFWDSVMDRFSDLSLFVGVIYLYAELDNTFYVMVAALAMIFSVMTSYSRARAESIIPLCKVGFMERPERIVLFMIGAFTNRMAAVLWVILTLSVITVLDRIYFTWREVRADFLYCDRRPQPQHHETL